MQQLQCAIIDGASPVRCAGDVLAAVPLIMRFIRTEMRLHRHGQLTVPQFRALVFTTIREEPSVSGLAEHLGLSLPTASRLVDLLVRRGLMERCLVAKDRRRVRLSLTPRGRATYQNARKATQAALARQFSMLPANERRLVGQAMQVLIRAFVPERTQLGVVR